uniref:Uncharacterized protein n=1 Tax=Candidatus Methanogaster sp. ANME-2c ERB4 TaxID=2759911 RepID=A0A7G9YFM1_9EURY|nr:hypothetical protein GHMBFEBI_00007 [Methanosarcinales archaeon ANME-2c ERB4]QNO46805.1 hypothetical protein FAOAFBCF_00003 [Methanosarcinales archaeon ANME-2c ERB4]
MDPGRFLTFLMFFSLFESSLPDTFLAKQANNWVTHPRSKRSTEELLSVLSNRDRRAILDKLAIKNWKQINDVESSHLHS